MEVEDLMESATSACAGAAVIAPLWLQTLNPYLQAIAVVIGVSWIGMQMYYKVRHERRKDRS